MDNLARQGPLDEALELFASLCVRAGTIGLLPGKIDTSTGSFFEHYPQALRHIEIIARMNLARLLKQSGRTH